MTGKVERKGLIQEGSLYGGEQLGTSLAVALAQQSAASKSLNLVPRSGFSKEALKWLKPSSAPASVSAQAAVCWSKNCSRNYILDILAAE